MNTERIVHTWHVVCTRQTSKYREQSLAPVFRKMWRGRFSIPVDFVMGWPWWSVTAFTVNVRVIATSCGEGTGGRRLLITATANASGDCRVRIILPPAFPFAAPTMTTFALLPAVVMAMVTITMTMAPLWTVFPILWATLYFACLGLVPVEQGKKPLRNAALLSTLDAEDIRYKAWRKLKQGSVMCAISYNYNHSMSLVHKTCRKHILRAAHFLWPAFLAFITFFKAFLIIFFSFRFLRFAAISNKVWVHYSKSPITWWPWHQMCVAVKVGGKRKLEDPGWLVSGIPLAGGHTSFLYSSLTTASLSFACLWSGSSARASL